jgi:RecG-like helicase
MNSIATRLPVEFASLGQPDAWPPPRGAARPERLEQDVDTLPGVGPSLRSKLARLGVRSVRDLLEYAPRDYQRPLCDTLIAVLFGEVEAAIAGVVVNANLR